MENEYISRRKAAASIGRVIADMKEMANGDPVQVAAIGLVERTRYYIETFPVEDVAPVRHGSGSLSPGVIQSKECVSYEGSS